MVGVRRGIAEVHETALEPTETIFALLGTTYASSRAGPWFGGAVACARRVAIGGWGVDGTCLGSWRGTVVGSIPTDEITRGYVPSSGTSSRGAEPARRCRGPWGRWGRRAAD